MIDENDALPVLIMDGDSIPDSTKFTLALKVIENKNVSILTLDYDDL